MSESFVTHQLEVQITDELALAESSRPNDPVVASDSGWRPNPTEVKAYEAQLLTLRGAVEACGSRPNGSDRGSSRVGGSGRPPCS